MADNLTAADGAADPQVVDLPRLKKMFEEARDLTAEARTSCLKDIDYYDSKQWSAADKRVLKKRKQPDIVINRIKPAVNGILGVVQRGKSEPRAYARTPKDEDSADVATDTLRFIADYNRFSALKLQVFKDILVPGTGAAIIEVDEDRQVTIHQIRWEEFFYDPRSRRNDFGDARYLGVAKWMYADEAAAIAPDKKGEIEGAIDASVGAFDEAFEDRPTNQSWVDRRSRRLLVVELYYKEAGQWMRCVYHSGGILDAGESPYQDHKGRPTCPIEAYSAYVDRDNNRYGPVRDMLGPQDEINKRRSKLLHLISMRQLEESVPGQSTIDPDAARAEAAKPDGIIPSGYKVAPTNDMAAGQLQLLQEAKGEIERQGPNPAILGRDGADSSGRALLARQQSGLVELAILFGGLEDWELRVYRQFWARAKQWWKDFMWLRVTDDEDAPKFVGLNAPKGPPIIGEDGQPVIDPKTGQPAEGPPQMDPLTGQSVLGYKNQVAEMDIDIMLDATPDTANLQQEQFQDLVQLIGTNPAYAQAVPFEVLLDLSVVPHKRALQDKLKTFREKTQQQQQQAAEAASRAKLENLDANTQKTHAEGILTAVRAQQAMNLPPELPMPAQGASGFDPSQAAGPPLFQG